MTRAQCGHDTYSCSLHLYGSWQNTREQNSKSILKIKAEPKILNKMCLQELPRTVPQFSMGDKFVFPIKDSSYFGLEINMRSSAGRRTKNSQPAGVGCH